MPINAHPEYLAAEKEYLAAQTTEEKIKTLKKMISLAPTHKGAEKLRAQLKTRLKKLLEQKDKNKKSGKSSKQGIKKEDMQAVIIGFTNSGKSSLLNLLTNVNPQIADYEFTTREPIIGMMNYQPGVQIQLIDVPAIESEYYDRGIVNSADVILITITKLEQIEQIREDLENAKGKQIIVFNKSDLLNNNEKRKISATLQSKKYDFVIISTRTNEGIEELKEKTFRSFGKMRIYTKEPGKEASKQKPMIMEPSSTVKDAAEKILKGFSRTIKETRIWGPSSKFSGQKVGLKHELKDLDIVEFKTK